MEQAARFRSYTALLEGTDSTRIDFGLKSRREENMPEARKYEGGCHCGRVRYTVITALTPVISCNCSICSKRGSLLTFVPAGQFEYVKGSDADLTEYQFNKHVIRHLFCPVCGILPYARGTPPGAKQEMVAINVRCLDDVDVKALEITEFDGRSK
jgi:hypothetical protein